MTNNEWTIPGTTKAVTKAQSSVPKPHAKVEKRSQKLLSLLKNDHNFDLVSEIVKTYHEIEELDNDLDRIRLMRSVQKDLMKYAFPVLKAEEGGTDRPAIILNFDLPEPKQMRNITHDIIEIDED